MSHKLSPQGSPQEQQTPPPAPAVRCGVLTVSAQHSPETDYGGRTIAYQITHGGFAVIRRWIVPNDPKQVDDAIKDCAEDPEVDALIITGGTGLSWRDATYEAVARRLTKRIDGFAATFAYLAYKEVGTAALHWRVIAGLVGNTFVVALPGNPTACELAMDKLVIPELARIVSQAKK